MRTVRLTIFGRRPFYMLWAYMAVVILAIPAFLLFAADTPQNILFICRHGLIIGLLGLVVVLMARNGDIWSRPGLGIIEAGRYGVALARAGQVLELNAADLHLDLHKGIVQWGIDGKTESAWFRCTGQRELETLRELFPEDNSGGAVTPSPQRHTATELMPHAV